MRRTTAKLVDLHVYNNGRMMLATGSALGRIAAGAAFIGTVGRLGLRRLHRR